MTHTLCVADPHCPFDLPEYLDHCKHMQEVWGCERVVIMGDVVDAYAQSRYAKDPSAYSSKMEGEMALERVKAWHDAFPGAYVCIGNHDARPYLRAKEGGLDPDLHMKSYAMMWDTPTWQWGIEWEFDDVYYTHGTGRSGQYTAAINMAKDNGKSCVLGHFHTQSSVLYAGVGDKLLFGMITGCGFDSESYAAAYSKPFRARPIVSCGIVVDKHYATIEPMV